MFVNVGPKLLKILLVFGLSENDILRKKNNRVGKTDFFNRLNFIIVLLLAFYWFIRWQK